MNIKKRVSYRAYAKGCDIMAKSISIQEKLIGKATVFMVDKTTTPPIIAPIKKQLSKSKVALITTAGVLLKSQEKFNTKDGDPTFRLIPSNVDINDLTISHGHYDQSEAEKDVNCVFPIERLSELKEEGFIGEIATNHFGFMGYIPNPKFLVEEFAPQAAKLLVQDNVDIAIISPG